MAGLFDEVDETSPLPQGPLAERVRPRTLEEVAGQGHLLGEHGPLRAFAQRGTVPSLILWGPPGTGKTTLAGALVRSAGLTMERLSAVEAGVKELRDVIGRAERRSRNGRPLVLFIDEIHRFNKAQQDALLHAVERGAITLIGATTENPSFEVNAALLSRCHVYRLRPLTDDDLRRIVERALAADGGLADVVVDDWLALLAIAAGDARLALNAVETAAALASAGPDGRRHVDHDLLQQAVQHRVVRYDKKGEQHYDTISAFIKSIRGSDPDAALLWLAVMIEAGEEATFIARRLIILASEDVGNADPAALPLAVAAFQAIERIGMPEGRIVLGQVVTYLACAPKSNASYRAVDAALAAVRQGLDVTVPLHLRNAPSHLMKQEGYGMGYDYPHDHPGHVVHADYFPDGVPPRRFYQPDDQEPQQRETVERLWPGR